MASNAPLSLPIWLPFPKHATKKMRLFCLLLLLLCCVATMGIYAQQQPHRLSSRKPVTQVYSPDNIINPVPSMFSGYLGITPKEVPSDVATDSERAIYYLFVPSTKNPTQPELDPLIVWVQGGPGCSGLIGLFIENGPLRFASRTRIDPFDQYSWSKFANVLYLDQPLGTGYSYATNAILKNGTIRAPTFPSNSYESGWDFNQALLEFFKLFPQYASTNIYLVGESYAGTYMPIYYQQMIRFNSPLLNRIKGIVFGNSMVKPVQQWGTYSKIGYVFGIHSNRGRVDTNNLFYSCLNDIQRRNFTAAEKESCQYLFQKLLKGAGGLSAYDVRTIRDDAMPFTTSDFVHYFNTPSVKANLDIRTNSLLYHKCNREVFDRYLPEFHSDVPDSFLIDMLSRTRVFFFDGQFDLRVNVLSFNDLIRRLNWDGRTMFNVAPTNVFEINGEAFGQFKSYSNLTSAVVYGGSHLAPYTQPRTTFEMLNRYLNFFSLCEPSVTKPCPVPLTTCPNNCTLHGTCNNGVCSCFGGYKGIDCSVGEFMHSLQSTNVKQNGMLYGKDVVLHRFVLNNPPSGSIFINVTLRKTSTIGNAFLFVALKRIYDDPIGAKRKLQYIVESNYDDRLNGQFGDFTYFNTSHSSNKQLVIPYAQIVANQMNYLDVAVMNSDHSIDEYEFFLSTDYGKTPFPWFNLGVAILLILLLLCVVNLIFIILNVVKYVQQNRRKAADYELLQSEEMDVYDDFDLSNKRTSSGVPQGKSKKILFDDDLM